MLFWIFTFKSFLKLPFSKTLLHYSSLHNNVFFFAIFQNEFIILRLNLWMLNKYTFRSFFINLNKVIDTFSKARKDTCHNWNEQWQSPFPYFLVSFPLFLMRATPAVHDYSDFHAHCVSFARESRVSSFFVCKLIDRRLLVVIFYTNRRVIRKAWKGSRK